VPKQITPLGVPPWMLSDFIDTLKSKRGPMIFRVKETYTEKEIENLDKGVIIERIACYDSRDKSDDWFLEPDDLSVKGGYLYVTDTDEPFSGVIHQCDGTDEYENGSYKDRLIWLCGTQCWDDFSFYQSERSLTPLVNKRI